MDTRIVKEILKMNENLLKRHLVLSKTVLDKLYQEGLIVDIIRRKILMYPTHRQVPLLLESLENQGLPSLRKFLEVLKDTGHGYLVETILDTQAVPVSNAGFRPETTFQGGRHNSMSAAVPTIPPRNAHTEHSPRRAHGPGHTTSLGTLLKMRVAQESSSRGGFEPRTLLTDPVMTAFEGPSGIGGAPGYGWYGGGMGSQPYQHLPARREDVPGTLYNLGQVFNNQQKDNEKAMVVLRQEEMAIKQLMEQNARDQQKVRRKQYAMTDLSRKLADINSQASLMYEPAPNPNISRYRLAQLNRIPWSVDN